MFDETPKAIGIIDYQESFLYTGIMSANFKIEGKEDERIDLLT